MSFFTGNRLTPGTLAKVAADDARIVRPGKRLSPHQLAIQDFLRRRICRNPGHLMHELSITQGMVDICEQHAKGGRVTSVIVVIGALSGVVPEAVEFCFEACTRGTGLEGAQLLIERVPGMGRCLDCGAAFPLAAYYDPCPGCGAYGIKIVSGEELRVKELEVE